MGCSVSKSIAEPHTITIKLSGCSNLSRSWSSPIQVADGVRHHLARNPNHPPKTESEHVVSLTSSTYGSLRVDPQNEALARAARTGTVLTGDASGAANHKEQVESVDMWKVMEGIEDEKAALKMLHSWMGKQQKKGSGSGSGSEENHGRQSPRVYHTVEDVDTILDVRKSLTANYRLKKGSSMDSIREKRKSQSGVHSPMMLERRSRALQISQEVIEELDDLRMRNLSRSLEFPSQKQDLNTFKGRSSQKYGSLSRSQDFGVEGRSGSQELSLRARRNLSNQSRDLEYMSRASLTKNQDHDLIRIRNLTRSQEFVRPSKHDDGVTTRRSSAVLRNVSAEDERRRIALMKPDVVLRSPMLRALGEKDMFVSSNNVERKKLQGQAESAALERKTALPRAAAGSTQVGSNLSSARRSINKLEPKVASAVAALSRLGEQRVASLRV